MITLGSFLIILAKAVFVIAFALGLVPLLIWLDRKLSAYIQQRPGPNRASLFGVFRLGGLAFTLADAIKLITKEDIIPSQANKLFYLLAPCIAVFVAFLSIGILPFADTLVIGDWVIPMYVIDLESSLLWFFAITSLAVYAVIFAGWSSNSKYPLLGGIRSSAQVLSYEIPLALSVIGPLMVYGTLNLNEIARMQGEHFFGVIPAWGIFAQPIAAIIFLVCSFAETNRAPFDLAEGESELVAGFHAEYSSMKFALFFLAEYVAMIVSSGVFATLFLGGWQIPWLPTERLIALAPVILPVMLGLTAVGALALSVPLYGYYRRHKNRFGDNRDKEPIILAVLCLAIAVGAGLAAIGAAMITLPAWAPAVIAFLLQMTAFIVKVLLMCCVFVWVRWTLPRFRYDQVMDLGWRKLLPIALANIFLTGLIIFGLQRTVG